MAYMNACISAVRKTEGEVTGGRRRKAEGGAQQMGRALGCKGESQSPSYTELRGASVLVGPEASA